MAQKKITELAIATSISNTDSLIMDTGRQTFQINKSDLVSDKQNTLQSGVNIKTVNGQSILGPGNIQFPNIPIIPIEDVRVNTESVVENKIANITTPTKVSDLENDIQYITGISKEDVIDALGYTPYDAQNPIGFDTGTITSIKMNGTVVGTLGEVNLGTVITDVSDKQDLLVDIGDSQNIKTINGNSILGTGNIEIKEGSDSYLKDANIVDNALVLTKQDDTIISFTGVGTIDYNELEQKPKINGIVIQDELSLDDLNIQQKGDYLLNEVDPQYNADKPYIARKEDIPTNVSELINDSNYIGVDYHDSTKQDKLISNTNIKTINGQTILGSGNLEVASEPNQYLKDAIVENDTLTITKKDGSSIEFQGGGEPETYIKSAQVQNNTLILTNKDDTTVEFSGGSDVSYFEIIDGVLNCVWEEV